MARVYADVNQNMPRSYWDYDSVNIGMCIPLPPLCARVPATPCAYSTANLLSQAGVS